MTLVGCGSSTTSSIGSGNFSSNSALSDENVIIQTRQDGGHLDVFTLGQPPLPDVRPYSFTQEERTRDYLTDRQSSVLGRNINGTIYRHPIVWDMSTDQGTTRSRVPLEGGDGAYVTDFAIETVRQVSLPTADGTYRYEYIVSNTNGYSINTGYTYTRSGSNATVTWRDFSGAVYQLHSGSPLTSLSVGFGMTLLNPFGYANEATQDARYTGTWTIAENFHGGVTGETGRFDLRRIGIANVQVAPSEINPASGEVTTIRGDIVALPTSTELTPEGWVPSGPVNWRIEIEDPVSNGDVRLFTGSVLPASSPDTSGKIADFSQTWDGTNDSGEAVLSASYPIRTQATAALSSGNILSKEVLSQVRIGSKSIVIENLQADPKNFDPESGDTTTISFDLLATGFELPNLAWDIEVLQNGELVYTFPTGQTQGSSTKRVSVSGDGIGFFGPVAGEVEYRVVAQACDNETQASQVDPVNQRSLFQATGSCAFTEDSVLGNLRQGLTVKKLTFNSASDISNEDGEPFEAPQVYYDKDAGEGSHHPILLAIESESATTQTTLQRLSSAREFGDNSIEIEFTVRTESTPQNYQVRIRRGETGDTLAEENVEIPAGDSSTYITATVTVFPEFEKKVHSVEFIKLDVKKEGEEFENEVVPLKEPIYIGLRSPRSPFVEGSIGPSTGMLDIATFLADGATTESEVRDRILTNMFDWLKSKNFIYNADKFHFDLEGLREDRPVGGIFNYYKFMRGFNGESEFWQGDCEDVSALYVVLNLSLGVDMKLVRVTGEPTLVVDTLFDQVFSYDNTFRTNPQRACGVSDRDPMSISRPHTPVFEDWQFIAHQAATWEGKIWDPTFEFGSEGNVIRAVGLPSEQYYQLIMDENTKWVAHPEFRLVGIQ